MYGGAAARLAGQWSAGGLSPRVRGSRWGIPVPIWTRGSIPACTGEPREGSQSANNRVVYPRVYGGARCACYPEPEWWGLSPRVRGSRPRRRRRFRSRRSIPACTGEPLAAASSGNKNEVYPRVYGGAKVSPGCDNCYMGLSPRVRGSHGLQEVQADKSRSIPACTGEPDGAAGYRSRPWVYPRVYGGAPSRNGLYPITRGLSPRVRGSQHIDNRRVEHQGSIPACTGEPVRMPIRWVL